MTVVGVEENLLVNEKKKAVGYWLLICCALVFLMVIIGGATRLTGSGLSIVEWKPVTGILPPLTHDAWVKEFAAYQTSPQYHKINHGMTLEEFEGIYWLEYIHRLVGRGAGVIFLLPLLWFWWRGALDKPLVIRLVGIFMLGGLQGFFGWYMVKSGLVDDPHVSPYRLALHLLTAVVMLGLLLWTALGLLWPRTDKGTESDIRGKAETAFYVTLGLILLQMALGAFVAGLHAGLTYNTWPLMDGRIVPEGFWHAQLGWRSLFEHIPAVQFLHRWVAFLAAGAVFWLWWHCYGLWKILAMRRAAQGILALTGLQIGLGIMTLLHAVPIHLGVLHQAVGVLLFANVLVIGYLSRS